MRKLFSLLFLISSFSALAQEMRHPEVPDRPEKSEERERRDAENSERRGTERERNQQ